MGQLDCHYGLASWTTMLWRLSLKLPNMFPSEPILNALHVFTDDGHAGSANAAFKGGSDTPVQQGSRPCKGSAQYKEMLAVVLVMQDIPGPLNLYTDSLYMANLMPHSPGAHICLDAHPISLLMVALQGLLQALIHPICYSI